MNKEFFKKLDKAIEVAAKHQMELMKHKGVVSVGAGPERKNGKLTGEAAIVITVQNKRTVNEVKDQGEELLPSEIQGVKVDVIAKDQPQEAPEIRQAQAKAKQVIADSRQEWLATPNITAMGYGYKEKNGQLDFNTIAIKFFVAEKLSPEELKRRKFKEIPSKIEGIPTDVIKMSPARPAASSGSRGDRHDPLKGGVSVGVEPRPFYYGTYGATVFDRTSNEQMVLSNQHVLDANPGANTTQPSPVSLDDSVEVGFQLDICNPLHFIRLDTPNTTVGTILAGGAVAAAVAAALSDEIDPTRRGQNATVPPAGAKTLSEHHKVKMNYPEMPIAGTPFTVHTDWQYRRQTDVGDQHHGANELKKNPHVLADKLLLTDKTLYHPGETIRLFGLILHEGCAPQDDDKPTRPISNNELSKLTHFTSPPASINLKLAAQSTEQLRAEEPQPSRTSSVAAIAQPQGLACRCERYHTVAILTPTTVDKAFPVIMREPVAAKKNELASQLLQVVKEKDDKELLSRVFRLMRYGCLYTGTLNVGDIPLGSWKHYFYVQTVNVAPEGMNPLQAAQIIGGLPVSQNAKADLDVGCGPFIFEDGSFDIELI